MPPSELLPVDQFRTWAQFAVEVDRTGSSADASGDGGFERQMRLVCLGVFGETGEVVDLVKKHSFHHKPVDPSKIASEIGDVLWYIAHGHNCCLRGGGTRWLDGNISVRHDLSTVEIRTLASRGIEAMALALPEAVNDLVGSIFFDDHPVNAIWCSLSEIDGAPGRVVRLVSILQAVGRWYGVTLDDAVRANVAKLRLRYPDGFSAAAAARRADEDRQSDSRPQCGCGMRLGHVPPCMYGGPR